MTTEKTPSTDGLAIALARIAEEAERRTGRLDLSNLGLERLPEELFALTHLRHLKLGPDRWEIDFAPNHIDAQRDRLAGFRRLESLSVAATDLSDLSPLSGLGGLQTLNCSGTSLSDLSSLSRVDGLQTLNCSWTLVSDLSPLSGLGDLQTLYCSGTLVSDLSPLSGLGGLQTLDCSGTLVSDLSPLSGLDGLQTLYCSDTSVSDLSPLFGVGGLQTLRCSGTSVADLSPLSGLGGLQTLYCSGTSVLDLSPLSGLGGLQTLYCSGTSVSDLSPLSGLDGLQTLNCSHTSVSDLSPLSGLGGLQTLNCSWTLVSDLSALSGLGGLQTLDCSGTSVSNLSPLSGLSGLQALNCSGTSVSDLSPLSGLDGLRTLNCFQTLVPDLSPLSGLDGLQTLHCFQTSVSDLSPLSGLGGLQTLDCSGTSVSDLSPLFGLGGLQTLDCSGTSVSDLSPLSGLDGLQTLNCSGTSVSDLSPLSGLDGLQTLHCFQTSVSDLSPLSGLDGLQTLNCSDTPVSDLSPLSGLGGLQTLNCSDTPVSDLSPLSGLGGLQTLYLYNVSVPGVPAAGVLSQSPGDNCLDRLRAQWTDLAGGAATLPNVKLLLIGNGRVGKTQIARRLDDLPYEPDSQSTHGIRIGRVDLAGEPKLRLHVWDFGGQDIYHGAHALFLSSPALLAVVWAREVENEDGHSCGGLEFRNQKLPYWLAVAHHQGHRHSPLLVVQTRCDRQEQEERTPPAPAELLERPGYCEIVKVSARNGRGFGGLTERLADAAAWMRDPARLGTVMVGAGRLRVQRRLEALRDADEALPPAERRHRLLTMDQFEAICAEEGGVSSPPALLVWLDAEGTLFHRPGLFDDRIVLDQNWALEAIYAVFDRDGGALTEIRRREGRFTRDLLDRLVWADHRPADRELFTSMMQSCGICFEHRKIRDDTGEVVEYIAPDLLPDVAAVQDSLAALWDDEQPTETALLAYPLLHDGLIRGIMATIGERAGDRALYWKGGLCGYEKTCGSRLRIEQVMTGPEPWRGTIRVQTQKGQAVALLDRLVEIVERAQSRIGLRADPADHRPRAKPEREDTPLVFEPETPPRAKPKWYVSYAWGDKTPDGQAREKIVDDLCAEAERLGHVIVRDKQALSLGDRISTFMKELGEGDRVFIVLSDKYLRSQACMFELSEVWRTSQQKDETFLTRVRVYTLPDTPVWNPEDWMDWAIHWKKEFEKNDARVREHGTQILGKRGAERLSQILYVSTQITDILGNLADTLQPRTLDELTEYGFGDPPA